MTPTAPPDNALMIKSRYVIRAVIRFETAWRIGTGREGQSSDLGVMLDPEGAPLLPGSSVKGKLRSTCEVLAHALGLSACMLDHATSGLPCVSDVKFYSQVRKVYRKLLEDPKTTGKDRIDWISHHTCDVCKLFGSPVRAAKLKCSDGALDAATWPNVIQVRDGVVLDRDSHTAVDGLKFDYEVVPAGTSFSVRIDLEDPTDAQLALVGAALFEWHAGAAIGGFTSRGLGRFRLEGISVAGVDFGNASERINYLTQTDPSKRLSNRSDWVEFFSAKIKHQADKAPEV